MSYTIREQLAASGNYGGARTAAQIKYLVIHYTGNDGDTAENNAKYYQNNVVKASAHYFVDDDTVYRSVPELRVAWAVGGKKYASCATTGGGKLYGIVTNTNSISVELCGTKHDGTRQASEKTLENAASFCRGLMEKYKIPIGNVYRHFDVTGKLCPAYMVEETAWAAFKTRLEDEDMDIEKLTEDQLVRLGERMQAALGKRAVSDALAPELEEAKGLGITDGSAPCAFATRAQVAVMVKRAAE